MKMRLLHILILTLAASQGLRAQVNPEVLQFTRGTRDPRAAAFAGAGAASATNPAYAAFRGASALAFYDGTLDAAVSYQYAKPGSEASRTDNLGLGVAGRIGDFGIALGGAYESGVPVGFFSPSNLLVALGAAYGIGESFSIGLNARYAREEIAEGVSLGGFSADVTAGARFAKDFTLIAGAAMLGPKVEGSSGEYPQPAHALVALGWKHGFGKEHSLELLLDGEYYFSGSVGVSAGAEYGFRDMVFVRGGYRSGTPALPSHASAGAGFKFKGFRIDAAYIFASDILGGGVSAGIGYNF